MYAICKQKHTSEAKEMKEKRERPRQQTTIAFDLFGCKAAKAGSSISFIILNFIQLKYHERQSPLKLYIFFERIPFQSNARNSSKRSFACFFFDRVNSCSRYNVARLIFHATCCQHLI
jgi:hypothetical protein